MFMMCAVAPIGPNDYELLMSLRVYTQQELCATCLRD